MAAARSGAALVAVAAGVALLVLALAPEASRAERFVVGDAARWTWGYNYTDWVIKKAPFFQNDTLGKVFFLGHFDFNLKHFLSVDDCFK
jgi:hypothetical protein